MPRKKKTSSGRTSGVLALARKAGEKALKKSADDWRVELDPDSLKEPLPHIATGSIVFDFLIGGEANRHGVQPCPGVPRKRVTQIWGHESAGKTTFALSVAAQACRDGGTVLYVDWENAIVPDYAEALGVPVTDQERFELVQPDTLEDGLKLAVIYALAGVDLIVFDSVGAAVPARIANRDLSDVGEQARVGELQAVWSQELPNLRSACVKKNAAVLGISQIRAKIGGMGRGPKTQPQGGNAWKFYSDVRLELRKYKTEKTKLYDALIHKKDDRVTGSVSRAKVIKCKLSNSQGREALFYLRHGEGIDDVRSMMEIGVSHGVIKKGGAWLTWTTPDGEEIKVQGTENFRKELLDHPEWVDLLRSQVVPHLGGQTFEEDHMEEDEETDVDALLAEAEGNKKESEAKSDEDEDDE